jgi:chitin disaccharide deacetylase
MTRALRQLIVNADDFGISVPVNEGIRDSHVNGIVTSASIMAVGRAFEHACSLAQQLPNLDLGAHLTLTEERPLSDPAEVPSLVTREGRFHPHASQFAQRLLLGRIRLDEVRLELRRQLVRLLAADLPLSRVDSHQHVHVLPGVRGVVASLAAEFGIRSIRDPFEPVTSAGYERADAWVRRVQHHVLNRLANASRVTGTSHWSPEHFRGFAFGGRLNVTHIRTLLRTVPWPGTCELMCHPAHHDPAGQYAHWRYDGHGELRALIDGTMRQFLEDEGITLTSFRACLTSRADAEATPQGCA